MGLLQLAFDSFEVFAIHILLFLSFLPFPCACACRICVLLLAL